MEKGDVVHGDEAHFGKDNKRDEKEGAYYHLLESLLDSSVAGLDGR
jgi:hypothetical protein